MAVIRCAVCIHIKRTDAPMEKHGAFPCAKHPAWQFFNPRIARECAMFEQVSDAALPARLKWEAA